MFRECRHILFTGRRCKSPAVNGNIYCFNHFKMTHHAKDGLDDRKEPLILPPLEDIAGIQIALMQVTNALGSGRITNKQAGLYLYSLQIASTLAIRAERQSPVRDSVRSLTCDDWGNYIAEESTICEPPHDCLSCKNRNTCAKFEDYEEEVEELEQQLAEQEEEEFEGDEDNESADQSERSDDGFEEELEVKLAEKEKEGEQEQQHEKGLKETEEESILEALQAQVDPIPRSLVSGHEFTRAENTPSRIRASAPAHAPNIMEGAGPSGP